MAKINWKFALTILLVMICSLYLALNNSDMGLSEQQVCERLCHPNLSAIEKVGNRLNSGWRSGEHPSNYKCVCRDPKTGLVVPR